VIDSLADDVTGWRAGDAVVAFLPMNAPGAAASFVAVPAALLAPAPRSVDLASAAALPSSGLTAWQSLFEHGGLTAGQRLLINGAGGAVGGYAVQLAKQAGATVTVTASPRSADHLRSYGADRIVDHTSTPLAEAVAGSQFDVVLNLVTTTPEETAALVGLVADGGVFVSPTVGAPADPGRDVRTVRVMARSDAAQLADLSARVDAGTLRIDVAQSRPLTDVAAVHDDSAAGRLPGPGKTVLVP
jgi:NADPH:quinone reductase-like Zn-dependent oxidoreductase